MTFFKVEKPHRTFMRFRMLSEWIPSAAQIELHKRLKIPSLNYATDLLASLINGHVSGWSKKARLTYLDGEINSINWMKSTNRTVNHFADIHPQQIDHEFFLVEIKSYWSTFLNSVSSVNLSSSKKTNSVRNSFGDSCGCPRENTLFQKICESINMIYV